MIPSVVKIGGFKIMIEESNDVFRHNDAEGITVPDRAAISLHRNLPPDIKRETLLHELLHFCWYISNLPEEHEEETIRRLTPWLYTMLTENKFFKNWIE